MTAINSMGLSESQRAAVYDPSSQVLVAAGAGSGKTRLLVAYFVHALVYEGIPISELGAVTFTRKAAAELISRVRSSLETCGRPDLARSLDAGFVGTIHSLCRRLLKEHALDAGVDPAFGVIEPDAAALVKQDVCNRIWAEAVEQASDAELEVLAGNEKMLRDELVPLYDRLRGIGFEHPFVHISSRATDEACRSTLASAIRSALTAAASLPRRSATLEADLQLLERCLEWLEGCRVAVETTLAAETTSATDMSVAAGSTDDLRQAGTFFPSRRTRSMEAVFEPVRKALTSYRCLLAEVRLEPVVKAMNGLLERFDSEYGRFKKERGVLDFVDLELHARTLLQSRNQRGERPILGPRSRVMIDEFQDTNELQCNILEGLCASALLMVGDERQSIYRFRGADVDVFARRESALKQKAFTGRSASEPTAARGFHRLDTNYRSRSDVLAFVNRLFSADSFFGSRFVALECGRELPSTLAPNECATLMDPATVGQREAKFAPVEVLVVSREQDGSPEERKPPMQRDEAEVVGERIASLINEDSWQPGEIVVLTPTLTHADQYQRALTERGVDVYVVRGKGYYSKEEVSDLRCLLRLLVNPHDDLSLVTVLRSPLVGLSDDALYLIAKRRKDAKDRSLWETLRAGQWPGVSPTDLALLGDFKDRITALRRRVGRPGLSRLIDDAVSDFGYDVHLLASKEGGRRFANVRKLMRLADEFEALQGPNLAVFVGALQSMDALASQEGSASTLAEGENVVRVMTIHQAKGLEFPLVILTGMGGDVRSSSKPSFMVGRDGRIGVFLKDSRNKTYESYDLFCGPAVELLEEEKTAQRAEDVRLLYVAMTRARDGLIIVGAVSSGGNLESSRIGRVVQGLGLQLLPSVGETIRVGGLNAVVKGVASERSLARQASVSVSGMSKPSDGKNAEPLDKRPRFLSAGSPCLVPRSISFSSLATYLRCPRQFYLERVLNLRSDGEVDRATVDAADLSYEGSVLLDDEEISGGREVGLVVHGLLEGLTLDDPRPSLEDLQARANLLARVAGLPLSQAQLERAVRLTQAFWSSPIAGCHGLGTAMKEAPFFYLRGDTLIRGVIDLVWQDAQTWFIVDYKTNALKGRRPRDVAAAYELQAALYSLAVLQSDAESVSMDFLFLEMPELPANAKFTRDDVPRLKRLLDQALDTIARGVYPAARGEVCACCTHSHLCAHLL